MKRKYWALAAIALLLAVGAFCLWRPSGGAAWRSLTGLFGGGKSVASSGAGAESQTGPEAASKHAAEASRQAGGGAGQTGGFRRNDKGNPGGASTSAGRTMSAKDRAQAAGRQEGRPVASKRLSVEELRLKADRMLGETKRRSLNDEYARFFEVNGLSFEQRERALDILVREFLNNIEALRDPARRTDATGKKLDYRTINRDEAYAALSQVLPLDKLELYEEYRASLFRRQLVEDVNVVLARHSEQLAPEVVDSVTRILQQYQISPGALYLDSPVSQETYDFLTRQDPLVLTAISKVMSPRQFELFKLSFAARYQVKR